MRLAYYILVLLVISGFFSCQKDKKAHEKVTSDLEKNFVNPPHESKPRTWMHAMSGNMSKEGLTKDLESMAEVGLGGLLLFNITQGIPNGPIIYNSPEHHEMITHAAKEAERLGLSFGVHNCDGWSSSGGPWITPEDSMKMVVWSETQLEGGKSIETTLSQPTTRENFYKDIAVIAYPSLASELDDAHNFPNITSSDPKLDITTISDDKKDNESIISKKGKNNPWIQFNYSKPKTIRSAKLIFNDRHATATLQTSKDGKKFSDVRELFKVRTGKGEWAINDHFEGITSQHFRLKLKNKNNTITLKEVELSATRYINNLLGRTSIARTEDHQLDTIKNIAQDMIIAKEKIKNLSNQMDSLGILKTILPKGDWTILRLGYTSTGAFNKPASDEGRGLEVDKLKRSAFKKHYDAFVKKVINNTKSVAPNAMQYAEIDSYEMGGQNWTENFDTFFKEKHGYDILKFLPVIAGRFVESAESSDAILWDYRNQICDMMTKNYFQYFTELCHEDEILSYVEPYGFGPLNDLDVGATADIPMGEFWMNRPVTMAKSAISAAHIYGKPIISAESFTSRPELNWRGHPAIAKNSGDLAWAMGINEFMFHRFAHQANTHVEPGMTMNRWGFHFDRTQTWWYNAGADWFRYIARGSYLLRQGNPVSDLLVFVGDGSPNSSYRRDQFDPEIPKTINFDCVNTDVLLNRITIEQNEMKLPEGTSYKVLILKNTRKITLSTLKRIHEIAEKGIPIYGEIPEKLAGYQNNKQDHNTFEKLSTALKNKIKKIEDWKQVLLENKIDQDLQVAGREDIYYSHRKTAKEDIYFLFNPDSISHTFTVKFRINNKIPELWNPMDASIKKSGQFNHTEKQTTAKIPLKAHEAIFVLFREETSKVVSVANNSNPTIDFFLNKNNVIQATVKENQQYEVDLADGKTWKIETNELKKPLDISGKWDVTFNKIDTYAGTINFDSLQDWKDHPLDSIRHYSGTASYKKKITIPETYLKSDKRMLLNLGDVKIIAEVIVNDKKVATLWIPPFEVDITTYLKSGENSLEIKITNQWSNKLIGDERFPANDDGYKTGGYRSTNKMPTWYTNNQPRPKGKRTTFTTAPFYKKDDQLMPSGLLGPVRIYQHQIITHDPKHASLTRKP